MFQTNPNIENPPEPAPPAKNRYMKVSFTDEDGEETVFKTFIAANTVKTINDQLTDGLSLVVFDS